MHIEIKNDTITERLAQIKLPSNISIVKIRQYPPNVVWSIEKLKQSNDFFAGQLQETSKIIENSK